MATMALGCAGQLYGLSCTVTKHRPATDADKAMLAGDYSKAEDLYKAELAKQPGDGDSELGLIHALLREQRVDSAAVEVASAVKASPKSAALATARGEVEYRKGELWNVEPTVVASYKLDPCNGRTRLLFARVLEASARYATAKQQYTLAHEFDPGDPEITLGWIKTLPVTQRAAELETFLASPNGTDAGEQAALKAELDRLKLIKDQPGHECKLASGGPSAEIPFIRLNVNGNYGGSARTRGYGIEVALNDTPTRLQIDTRGQGLTVYRAAAEHAGLKRIGEEDKSAAAGPMGKPSYTVLANSVKIGGLEFKDCEVNVIDGRSPNDDGPGFIGMDVFSQFMVTVDFPMRKLAVGSLPARPGAPAPTAQLVTIAADFDPVAGTPEDRTIAPELKDYTQFYRVGHDPLLPTALSATDIKLFVPDDATPFTNITEDAATAVTKVHEDQRQEYGPQKVFVADEVSFNFAHVGQKLNGVSIADTSMASKMDGTEISGFLGSNMLTQFTLHIDYRDGLLKADYVPGRGYKFDDNSSHP
jgi:hypothetical protein